VLPLLWRTKVDLRARAAHRRVDAPTLEGRRRLRADQRVQQRLDMAKGRLLDLEKGGARLADHGVRTVNDDKAVATELPPSRHVVLIHPRVVAVLEAELVTE
jgi:hypothetical protein